MVTTSAFLGCQSQEYIENYDLYWRPTDYGTLIPFLESFNEKYGFYSSEIVADSGYGSEQNYEFLFANGMTRQVEQNLQSSRRQTSDDKT